MRKTKRNLTAAVLVFAATLSATPVFAAKEKEESTSKANTESISKEASAQSLIMQAMRLHFQRK